MTDTMFSAALTRFNIEGIDPRADFHTLTWAQVDAIAELAKELGYRKPRNASGSTARYFFAAVVREWGREKR